MTWATPMLAGLVAAIAIPALVILYFLKLRRTPREVSTTLLWKQAIQDIQANAPFQKLRKNILLFLQLIILALILIALAQPRSTSTSIAGQKIVILFDRSASMQARDAGSESNPITRFEHAKAHAIDLIESLASPSLFEESARADEAMIIAFGSSAEIVENFTSDKSKLIAAIESLQPTDSPSSIEEAFRLAQAQRPNRAAPTEDTAAVGDPDNISAPPSDPITYHLFSDGRIPDLDKIHTDPSAGPTPSFEYHAIGSPTSVNLGIVSLQAERDYEKPTKLSIFVGVQSTDPQERSVDAELVVQGATIAVRSIKLPPAVTDPTTNITEPAVGGVVFELDEPRALTATVRLAGLEDPSADALDRDNASTVIIPPAARARVALVTTGSVFLTRAIDVLPIADFKVLSPSRYESIRNTDEAAAIDLFILDGYTPQPKDGPNANSDRLDPGRYLVLGDIPRSDQPVNDEGLSENTTQIINWRRTHPLLRGLTLDSVIVGEPRKLTLPEDSELVSLAETPVGPAIIEESTPDTRAVYVTFAPKESNWPLEPSFIVFLGSAVDYLAATDASTVDTNARQLEPGSILADRLPLDASAIRVRLPDSTYSEDIVPSPDGRIVFGPITSIGRYQLQWSGSAGATDTTQGNLNTRDYAANLLSAPESNTGTQTTIALSNAVVSADAAGQIERLKEWWPYLLAAALAIMLLEWWVYNRKVYF